MYFNSEIRCTLTVLLFCNSCIYSTSSLRCITLYLFISSHTKMGESVDLSKLSRYSYVYFIYTESSLVDNQSPGGQSKNVLVYLLRPCNSWSGFQINYWEPPYNWSSILASIFPSFNLSLYFQTAIHVVLHT